MQLTSPSRRALGLLAAGTLGAGTFVVGVGGVATAATLTTNGAITVPANSCYVSFVVNGASGGSAGTGVGGLGATMSIDDVVLFPGDEFFVEVGAAGTTTGGAGASGANGGNGGASGAGGGGATALYSGDSAAGDVLAIAGGGGGAGAGGNGGDADSPADGLPDIGGGDAAYGDVPGAGGSATAGGTDGGDGGLTGGNGAETFGGGGGGGWAGGGGGASDGVTGAGGGGGSSYLDNANTVGTAAGPGAGSVEYTFETCAVPNAPDLTLDGVGDETATISFWPAYVDEMDPVSAVTGWEYTVDGGTPMPLAITSGSGDDLHTATIEGLTNGTAQQIRVHATSASGDGVPSNAVSATPYQPAGAPTAVVFTTGPSQVNVTWEPPTDAGTYPITGYQVILGYSDGESGGYRVACETDAAGRSCLGGAQAGLDYTLSVVAVSGDMAGTPFQVQTGVIPAAAVPTEVPTASAPLTTTKTSIVAGQEVTLKGDGYLPGSTVTLLIYSEPQVLTTVVVGEDGTFEVTVTVPAGLAAGRHSLVASGVDTTGALRYLRMDVDVSASGAQLANTGFSAFGPLAGGLTAVLLGAGLLVATRRRPAVAAN